MDFQQMLASVATLRDHLYYHPEEYVKQWSSQQCGERGEYYDIPLIRLVAFLTGEFDLPIESDAEGAAVLDIVKHSPLSSLLEHDVPTNSIRFKKEITEDYKKAIANYLRSRAVTLAD
jgi:hypothetical protein